MKRLHTSVALVLLTGCGSPDENPRDHTNKIQEELLANLQAASTPGDSARLQTLIDRAMSAVLPDADQAQYRNVRAGLGGSVCGEVAAPVPDPAARIFRRFVVTADAIAVVANGPGVAFNDPSDALADAWIRWCATPDELKMVAAELQKGPPPIADEPVDAPSLPPRFDAPPTPPIAAPAADPLPPTRYVPPPEPRIDSFARSVQRPG